MSRIRISFYDNLIDKLIESRFEAKTGREQQIIDDMLYELNIYADEIGFLEDED